MTDLSLPGLSVTDTKTKVQRCPTISQKISLLVEYVLFIVIDIQPSNLKGTSETAFYINCMEVDKVLSDWESR